MASSGWLTEEKSRRVVTHAVTEVGKQQLGELGRYLPLAPAKGTVNPPADAGRGPPATRTCWTRWPARPSGRCRRRTSPG
jgi:hypothetical protein